MRSLFPATAAAILGLAFLTSPAEAADAASAADPSLEKEVDKYLEEAQPAGTGGNTLRWSWKNGPRAESADGAFLFKLQGRLMVDWIWAQSDEFDGAVTADGVFFRRVRLAVAGHAYRNLIYKLQLEFASGEVELKDVFLGLRNLGGDGWAGTFIGGHEKEPFGFEFLTSSKYLHFMERSAATNAFVPDRNTGASFGVVTLDKRLFVKTGIYRQTDDQGAEAGGGNYQWTIRVAWWGLYDKDTNRRLHLGVGYSLRNPNGGSVRFRARPGLDRGDRTVDTGTIDGVSQYMLFDVAAVFTWRSFHVAFEWIFADITERTTGPKPSFSGWYVQVGWWITGEQTQYKNFVFSRTAPRRNLHDGGGWGAWEVTFRLDSIDLTDSGIDGGEQLTYVLGVNWHWNPNTRILFNLIYADVDNSPLLSGANGTVTAFTTRFQFDF